MSPTYRAIMAQYPERACNRCNRPFSGPGRRCDECVRAAVGAPSRAEAERLRLDHLRNQLRGAA